MDKLPDKRKVGLILVLLAVATFAVYWQLRNHDFIGFDDDLYVTENSSVQAGLTWQGIKWAFTTTHAYNWHPLVWISHMLDCQLYGLNPAGHHLTNVFFHIANTLLLFLIFRRMTGALWRSAFVAALFALHPLHVESVAWVSERKDVLSTFFWMLTMWFYIRYTQRPRLATYVPAALALALGLMAKQMLVTLPFVLLLLDYWPLERFTLAPQKPRDRKAALGKTSLLHCLLEKLPLLALSVIASLIVLLVQSKAALIRGGLEIPIRCRLGNALLSYAKYIAKTFWPTHLGILYPHPGVNLPLWQLLVSALLLAGISIAVIRAYRSRRWLLVGWLWYLGTLVPVIGLVQVGLQAMADRYTYAPLIGLFLIIAWAAAEISGKLKHRKIALATAALTLLSALTALTSLQLSHWQNSITLYKHTVAVTANNDILHYNLGVLLLRQGKVDQAIKHWSQAVRIKPDQPTIHKNLATLLARQGKLDRAIEHYRQALKFKPNDTDARRNLKNLLAKRKKLDTVEQLYNRANLLAEQGKTDKAIEQYRKILELDQNHTKARHALDALLKNTR